MSGEQTPEELKREDDAWRAENGFPPGGPLAYLFRGFRDPPKVTLAEREANHPQHYRDTSNWRAK